jgi:uncharacterized protein (TIGR03066 family)
MKKLFALLFAAAVLGMAFVSCGDDKDEPSTGGDVVGTWQQIYNDEDGQSEILVQFTKDGKFHEVDVYKEVGGEVDVDIEHGTYTIQGNKMTIRYDDDDYYIECTFSVKGDKMTVSQSGYSLVYNRVSDSLIQRYL